MLITIDNNRMKSKKIFTGTQNLKLTGSFRFERNFVRIYIFHIKREVSIFVEFL